jgi:hypothetical protein
LETFYSHSQIQQSERGGFLQYAERPDDGNTPFLGVFSPFSVVNNQLVSAEFCRKHNRVAFAWI